MNMKGIARNIMILISAVIILAAGLVGTVAYFITLPPPAGPVAMITGVIKDSATNVTISGATVAADGYVATSGPDGNYSLAVPLGTYTLAITAAGYQTYSTTVSATDAQTYTANALITKTPLPTPTFVTENKLVYEAGATFQWLDPHVSYYQYDYWILWHSVETLMWYNKSSATDLIPWLASSWTMVNETTYDFALRQGITFQDGTPFNATAVWFSLNRLFVMDGTSGTGVRGSQAAWMVQQLVDPDGDYFTALGADPSYDEDWVKSVLDLNFVEIIDNYTIRLNLATPTSQLLVILAGTWAGIVSPTETITKDYAYHAWNFAAEQQPQYNLTKYLVHMAGVGDTYFNLPETGWKFGTGAYYVESVDTSTYKIVLKAYNNYWGGPGNMNLPPTGKTRIATIEYIYTASFATRLLNLRQGASTAIAVSETDIYSVVDRDTWLDQGILQSIIAGVTVHGVVPTLNTWWIDFNTNVTNVDGSYKSWQPFSDWRIRMAVACAVNMTHMNIYVNNRLSILANNIVPPGTFPEGSYNPSITPTFSFNLTRTRELLEDAYANPLNSTDYDMYFYNGTEIPAGVVDNRFGTAYPKVVEIYVQSGANTFQQVLTTLTDNLNLITRSITGTRSGLEFRVVIVPGGQQYTLASRHQIDGYMGGWIADYNHVLNWLMPMYYSRGTYPSWNLWNVTGLDDLYDQAVAADEEGNFTRLVEISNQMNTIANELVMYMVWWHDTEYFTRSSWLKGWYVNPVYGVDLWSAMYYEQP
ncbi:MAG: ABC transporter substrate-binding protein [Candidatus Bathyarchaeota archaeon]|nr:ABC transporter substrate-binding protein [Candidatus Bathyarchaeota archaeon]MDH5788296.1 ABC transporter substrate-binding protein [Candidatus Bathyarchaeota archaeon]